MFYFILLNTLKDMFSYPSMYNICTGLLVSICILLFTVINIRILRNIFHWFTSIDKVLHCLEGIKYEIKEVNDTIMNKKKLNNNRNENNTKEIGTNTSNLNETTLDNNTYDN